MNKKFSTLMLGMLLTSAFASAEIVNPDLVKVASELKDGRSYFVIGDASSVGGTKGVYDKDVDAFLSVAKNGEDYTFKSVGYTEDVKYLLWTYNEEKIGDKYYYTLKNEELGVYLSVDQDGNVIGSEKDDNAVLRAGYQSYPQFTQNSWFYSEKVSGVLKISNVVNTEVTVGSGDDSTPTMLLCEYDKNVLNASDAVAALNDVKGGAGFNLKFNAGNTDPWANDILTDLNLKAFNVNIPAWGNGQFEIPAGVYFATEYPASLAGTSDITTREAFEACTFVAVNPDVNYNIHEADRKNGIGFELMTVAGSAMNTYTGTTGDNASVKGEVYVGNACFSVIVPDPLRAAEEYNFKLNNVRLLTDASKTTHASKTDGLYVGVINDQNKNYLVTNTTALAFTTTNSTLYDVKKLLKSEDAPSIYTMQFVSNLYKDEDGNHNEYGQYLTVGSNGSNLVLSSVENYSSEDPMFQFVVSAVDTTNKVVTFVNRQTKKDVKVSLYENEDGSFTVYPVSLNSLWVESFDDANNENEEVKMVNVGTLQNTKVILTPVTVEDKFATFVNRAEGAGLVTFELAKNVDDATELYVGAYRDADDKIVDNSILRAYSDDATQFELVKSKEPIAIANDYVYLNGSRVLNSAKQDTVAYYTYTVKAFDATENWYLKVTSGNNVTLVDDETGASAVIIKKNVDGSVSLISSTLKDNVAANYFYVTATKDKDVAWSASKGYYDLESQLSVSLKTFMVEENPAISYEAVPQHVSFEAVRGGFMTKDENNDARLAIANVAAEDLTFWLDTVNSDQNIPSFYILKNGAFMYNATDSAKTYAAKKNYRFNVENNATSPAKLIFKAGELVTSDTIRTTINGQSVLVAENDNAPKNIKGGLAKFQYQIIRAEEGSDEYVIRQGAQYVCLYNNYFYMSSKKDEAYRFVIEKQAAPTANEGIEVSEVKVIAGNGQITIMGAAGKKVVVSNILGKVVASQTISSDNATIAVPAGIVAVAVEGEAAVKAVVK